MIVVGTGIKAVGQATFDAVACIQRAEQVFYLVDEPVTEAWIQRLNPNAESLWGHYAEGKPRGTTYREITNRIVSTVKAGVHLCAVFYGHPGVLVDSAHDAVRRLLRQGYRARMLPGISTLDCLFADLNVDPGRSGCALFEASDFVASRPRFDPGAALILWQVGALGEVSLHEGLPCRPERLAVLTAILKKSYTPDHRIALYEAAQFPVCDPVTKWIRLDRLPQAKVWPVTTLYVPPAYIRDDDPKVMRWFDEP